MREVANINGSVRSRRRPPTKGILPIGGDNNDDCSAIRSHHKIHVRRRDPTLALAAALVGGGIMGCLGLTMLIGGRLSGGYLYYQSPSRNGSRRSNTKAVDMTQVGYSMRPYILQLNHNSHLLEATALPRRAQYESVVADLSVESPWRVFTSAERKKQSKKYQKDSINDGVEEPCVHQYEWQTASLPTCNLVHEGNWAERDAWELPKRVNRGGWVEIWKLPEYDGRPVALKSKLYDVEWTKRNFDRYRRDAVCLEKLSSSPLILDIYSFCGVTAFMQYCAQGDLGRAIRKRGTSWTSSKKLQIAIQVMEAIAAVHNVDREGRASIAHTDISTDQFLNVGEDNFILNDFNRMSGQKTDVNIKESTFFFA